MVAEKYLLIRALRPFSFSVAIVVCLTGILAANQHGYVDWFVSALVLTAGLFLQAGVNLINDYSDLPQLSPVLHHDSSRQIKNNFFIGLCCFLVAAAIGLYLVYLTDLVLLLLFVVGLVGALGYTLEPLNYKRRGLAVVFVFWLMGVLMVEGSYYALSQRISLEVFYLSIPVSLFTSLLLLSNELRDYEEDREQGINTLSIRLGYSNAALLYFSLILLIYAAVVLLSLAAILPGGLWVLLTLPVTLFPCRYLKRSEPNRRLLTPHTGRSFLLFGLFYCVSLTF